MALAKLVESEPCNGGVNEATVAVANEELPQTRVHIKIA